MTSMILENVTVDFPIYNAKSRSLKNQVISLATGGTIGSNAEGHVVIRGLEAINLSLKDGDRLGLIGHNGSGKTTLLRVMSGVYYPSGGQISINGKCTSLINISLGIDPEATGRENIRIRGALLGFTRREMAEKQAEIEEFSELGNFLDMPVRTFSTGMQLRLAFSISTVIQPEILIMDEWLAAGDERFQHKANERLHELVNKTKILIIASHSKELLVKNCTRIVWLEHGKIKMEGDAETVADAYFGHQ
ncbi:ABC transporter ATP-binding protein [Phyllobacterium endophyticum]|jgi:lipopolysaccharide transport system ATP-binding protein|uniref:ABC transporter ATP-binding protein n=1 Tax=Phyllobacterium endophyticum TaxID=1149773 RepID=UPI0011CBEC52|nr:ABC transporter ATP-binding protein [Phyllobacterium endophyticum]TXR50901.1 ABC transporter ATP-binding protein [Phyllobacterium endophyticum]